MLAKETRGGEIVIKIVKNPGRKVRKSSSIKRNSKRVINEKCKKITVTSKLCVVTHTDS